MYIIFYLSIFQFVSKIMSKTRSQTSQTDFNVEENLSIYGFSMGGLTAMHLVMNGFPNVKCIALALQCLILLNAGMMDRQH